MQNITAGMEGVIGEQVAEDGTEVTIANYFWSVLLSPRDFL